MTVYIAAYYIDLDFYNLIGVFDSYKRALERITKHYSENAEADRCQYFIDECDVLSREYVQQICK